MLSDSLVGTSPSEEGLVQTFYFLGGDQFKMASWLLLLN